MIRFLSSLLVLVPTLVLARTEIIVRGMNSLSQAEVLNLVSGRLEHIRNQPATPWRAADAAFMVERIFRRSGFSDASVSWRIMDPQTIRLTITEADRELLGEITIEGIDDSELTDKLVRLFELNPQKQQIGDAARPPLIEEEIDTGLKLIRDEMKSLGYWDTEVEITNRTKVPDTDRTDFTIVVNEGTLHTIGQPTFEGERTQGLRELTSEFVGRTADTAGINLLRGRVTEFYRSEGFVNAEVRMSIEPRGSRVYPTFYISEGERFRLGEIDFEGLDKTNPERIRSRLEGLQGEYIDGTKVEERVSQIIATGAFSTVRMDTIPGEGELLDATFQFEEGEARGVSFTGGFDSYNGPFIGTSYYDRNFRGNLRNFTAGVEVSARALLGEISLADPWLWGTDATGKVRLFALSQRNEGYSVLRGGIDGTITYPLTDHYELDLTLGVAAVDTTGDGIPAADLGDTTYLNPYLIFNQRLDYRDSRVLPTKGWHLQVPVEIGGALGDLSTSYLKSGFEGGYYLNLDDFGQLNFGLRGGVLIPGGDSERLPIDLRYFNGGANSVRSYPNRELGPRSANNYPVGGQAYWVANLEYVRPVRGALKGVAFVDVGGLSREWEEFALNDPDVAVGLGLRFDLPIGPVRFEYGHNMTKDANEPSGTFHFSIGGTF